MSDTFKQRILPYLFLAAGILALSISPLLARWSVADGPVFAFYRMFSAVLVLTPFYIHHQQGEITVEHPHITRKSIIFPILGGMANACDLSFWYLSIHYTRLANATLLNNIAPLWVALTAWLMFREKLKGSFWVGLLMALFGAGIVLGEDFILHPSLNLGNAIGLLSSVFYAAYYLITQRGRRNLSALQYTFMMTISSGLTTLIFSLVFGLKLSGFPLATYLCFLAAGVVTQSIGFLALSFALGRLPASIVSPTMILQPVLSAVLAIPLLGESLQPGQWIGGMAVLGGIMLVNRSQDGPQNKTEAGAQAKNLDAGG
jgi:drug/metabolite transporter (DMT)-like permease